VVTALVEKWRNGDGNGGAETAHQKNAGVAVWLAVKAFFINTGLPHWTYSTKSKLGHQAEKQNSTLGRLPMWI